MESSEKVLENPEIQGTPGKEVSRKKPRTWSLDNTTGQDHGSDRLRQVCTHPEGQVFPPTTGLLF